MYNKRGKALPFSILLKTYVDNSFVASGIQGNYPSAFDVDQGEVIMGVSDAVAF